MAKLGERQSPRSALQGHVTPRHPRTPFVDREGRTTYQELNFPKTGLTWLSKISWRLLEPQSARMRPLHVTGGGFS